MAFVPRELPPPPGLHPVKPGSRSGEQGRGGALFTHELAGAVPFWADGQEVSPLRGVLKAPARFRAGVGDVTARTQGELWGFEVALCKQPQAPVRARGQPPSAIAEGLLCRGVKPVKPESHVWKSLEGTKLKRSHPEGWVCPPPPRAFSNIALL